MNESIPYGTIKVFPLGVGEYKQLEIQPERNFDVGEGKGKSRNVKVEGGTVGIIVDTRGRPFNVDLTVANRVPKLREYLAAFGLPLPASN